MTIGKGTAWGRPGTLPSTSPVFQSDRALAAYISKHLISADSEDRANSGEGPSAKALNTVSFDPVGLAGGSLWRTIGGPAAVGRYGTPQAMHYPCDVGIAVADGMRHVFVASLVARNRWWTRVSAVMNSQDMRTYRLGHRAHPGDALLDMYEAHLSFADVVKVARRAKLGSHLPHPGITERRAPAATFVFERRRALWIDERHVGKVQRLSVSIIPDAITVVI